MFKAIPRPAAARLLAAALCLPLAAAPASPDMLPPAGAHIKIEKAEILDLACARRKFKMENTRGSAKWFRYMGAQISGSGWHPHSILLGVAGTVLLVPLTALAVPTDLAAGPFRKECRFTLRVAGSPVEWAGRPLPGLPVKLLGQNQLETGVPDIATPRVFRSEAAAVTDGRGKFLLDLAGYVGRDKSMGLLWHINDRPGGTMSLTRRGDHFVLAEVDPGFGVGIQEMEPLTLRPEAR